jgi:hypothetical protein
VSDFRPRLKEVRDGLLNLHKSLLDGERATYERDVVMIDETVARKEPPATPEEGAALIAKARSLLVPAEEGTGFARRYFEVLQRDANAVLAHRDMLKVLGTEG